MIFHHWSIYNSLLSSHKIVNPSRTKLAELWQKNEFPNMAMRAISRQYFGKIWRVLFLNETSTTWFALLNYTSYEIIVVKYALDELFKGAELYELFKAMNEVLPNF